MKPDAHRGKIVEFKRGQRLLITENGKLFDQARIKAIVETGDGRILTLMSTINDALYHYRIGEDRARNYAWRLFLDDEVIGFDESIRSLTLEIIP